MKTGLLKVFNAIAAALNIDVDMIVQSLSDFKHEDSYFSAFCLKF
jgi:hypothetical protein